MEKDRRIIVYTDGASRGNPGEAGCGVVLFFDDSVVKLKRYIGRATNNQAEYMAFILALDYIRDNINNVSKIIFYTDSQLVERQLKGQYKVKNENIKELYRKVKDLLKDYNWEVISIPREENKEADRLANRAIDER